MYLLDTDICIYLLNGSHPALAGRLAAIPASKIGISAVTAAELRFGALNSERAKANAERVERFVRPLRLVPFDGEASRHFAQIKSDLKQIGRPIGTMDMLIAACALSVNAALVTNNSREFDRIEVLRVENWVRGDRR